MRDLFVCLGNIRRSPTAEGDPHCDGADRFERVLDMVEQACDRLIEQIREAL